MIQEVEIISIMIVISLPILTWGSLPVENAGFPAGGSRLFSLVNY